MAASEETASQLQQAMKKPKLEDVSIGKLSWKPRPILAPELTRDPVLEKAYVGLLKDKRGISTAIASLAGRLPCPQHLKRCTGLRIYLAPVGPGTAPDPCQMKQKLSEIGFDLSILEDELEVVDVPAEPARTRAQMQVANSHWPLNFHPDPRLEAVISGSALKDFQLQVLEACARLLVQAACRAAVGNLDCNGSALILEPRTGRVLALAAASLDRHPMWHASMLAIDLVARHQGGGAWPLDDPQDARATGDKRKHDSNLPLRYPASLHQLGDVAIFGNLETQGQDNKKKAVEPKDAEAYLCTGYWAVLLQEPCPLCAMALLHSRVARIFYGTENPRSGVLGSKAILHSVPGLNHRYHVWSGVLENECIKTLEKCRFI